MTQSNLPMDSDTGLPTVRDFEQLGSLLRLAGADAETTRVSEGMSELAARVEAVGNALAAQPESVGLLMVELLTALRLHRSLIVGLGAEWRRLYEYPAYLASVNNFRLLVGQWLGQGGSAELLPVTLEDFQMIAWRTLGEGVIMMDIYEQSRRRSLLEAAPTALDDARLQRAKNWWNKLKG
jgi:hypothetical protein